MAHYNQNTNIVSALRTRNHQVELKEDPINITYGLLDHIFRVLDEENISTNQIIPCFATLPKKSENVIANIVKKPHNFVKKAKNYLQNNPNDLEKLHPDFSEEGTEEMSAGHVGVFCQNLGITAYTLENYSNFKNKFLFNNGSILEINDYYNSNKSRGNVTFTELSEIINTLSSQDFAGMDKFRLRKRLRNIKEMRMKINKAKKNKRNDSCMSDFLTSPFSLVMGDLSAGSSSAGESALLTLDKKRDSLESKFRRASSEKISCLQETVSLLNQCIGEENQGRLQIEK